MIILGFDLQSTRLGWCVGLAEDGITVLGAGVQLLGLEQVLVGDQYRSREARGLRAFDARLHFRQLLERFAPSVVGYETLTSLAQHAGATAAHGWGAQEQALQEVVHLHQRDQLERGAAPWPALVAVGVGQGKKALAGSGRADKEAMAAAADRRWAGFSWRAEDCDAADAAGVMLAAHDLHQAQVAKLRLKKLTAKTRRKAA